MSTPKGYCLAKWVGPSAVQVGGRIVQPGDEVEVPETEAAESGNWQPPKSVQAAYDKAVASAEPVPVAEPTASEEN